MSDQIVETPPTVDAPAPPEVIPDDYKCGCEHPILPLAKWLDPESTECQPCQLAPVAQWYYETLVEQGQKPLAEELEKVVNEGTPLQICETMDKIKESVSDPIRERLKDFDCVLQSDSQQDKETTES